MAQGGQGVRVSFVGAVTDLSISIVNTNNRELLLACLETVRASLSSDVAVEIVVLDNASDDGSVEAVRRRFPGVDVITQEFRAGFGANHNTVIRATTGRYVYVLNEDTESEDWGFARIVAEMDAHPMVAALGPRIVDPKGRPQRSAWRFPSPAVALLGLPTLGRVGVAQSKGARPRSVDWVMGAALVLRREALEQVGLFDESFFIYFEEVDLCLRLRGAGWAVRYLPEVTVVHHESQSSAQIPERRINEVWRGRRRYWRKHHSAAGARVAALATGCQYLGSAGVGLLRRDRAYRGAMWLHARNAWRPGGAGLRELAEEWNRRAGVGDHGSGAPDDPI
jgi:N-acetylglucosaminyl-diphospho-decaprenol L-rhamnosyltransferase